MPLRLGCPPCRPACSSRSFCGNAFADGRVGVAGPSQVGRGRQARRILLRRVFGGRLRQLGRRSDCCFAVLLPSKSQSPPVNYKSSRAAAWWLHTTSAETSSCKASGLLSAVALEVGLQRCHVAGHLLLRLAAHSERYPQSADSVAVKSTEIVSCDCRFPRGSTVTLTTDRIGPSTPRTPQIRGGSRWVTSAVDGSSANRCAGWSGSVSRSAQVRASPCSRPRGTDSGAEKANAGVGHDANEQPGQ